jgi:hypothetical protein
MKPSPAYWEKSQPATRLACAEAELAVSAARVSEASQVTILVLKLASLSKLRGAMQRAARSHRCHREWRRNRVDSA